MRLAVLLIAVLGLGLWFTSNQMAKNIEAEFPPIGNFETVNGAQMHFVDAGVSGDTSKQAVIFIHGAGGNLRDLKHANGGRLEDQMRVIYVDRPGHGYSQSFDGSNDPKKQAASVAGLMEKLQIPQAIIVGHSFGGAIASTFAVLHPEKTAGLVLIAQVSHPWSTGVAWYYDMSKIPGVDWLFANLLAAPIGSLMYPGAVEEVFSPDPAPADFASGSGTKLLLRPDNFFENAADINGLLDHVTEFHPRYKEITAPTVIFHGDEDKSVNVEIHTINGMSKDIQGAEVKIYENMGHMPTYIVPDDIAEAVRKMAGI
ncbi:MAG: alpha/beta hydrolase [Pseudomonadota bacterium]